MRPHRPHTLTSRSRRSTLRRGQEYLPHHPSANSFDAHRFLHLADAHGHAGTFFARTQRDLFAEAVDIFDTTYLVQAVTLLGIPADEAQVVARTDVYTDAVRADQRNAHEAGIIGVPFTVFDNRLAVPGVATARDYRNAIQQARKDRDQNT
ncbi:DsbA family oxidoreductase [Streptomyces shenzhenensis]|uniref:DsbA family oxidoreductase n=1 Tax=Streptomyces shenzhenensis TaxID=943815 RepID=UPI0033C12ED6